MTHILLALFAFGLIAAVLSIVASRNNFLKDGIRRIEQAATDTKASVEVQNTNPFASLPGVWRHVVDWLEIYWWLPLSLLAVAGAAKLVLVLTGRATVEDANALVGFALRIPPVIAALCVMTITRQQSAHFLTMEEAKAHIPLTVVYHVKDVLVFGLVLYFFLH